MSDEEKIEARLAAVAAYARGRKKGSEDFVGGEYYRDMGDYYRGVIDGLKAAQHIIDGRSVHEVCDELPGPT